MKSYLYPIQIVNGDLATADTDAEIIASEVRSILDTRISERVYRQDYGSPNLVLKTLDLSKLITGLSSALETSLSLLGFSKINVEVDGDVTDLQRGVVPLLITYSLNGSELNTLYTINI